MLVLIDLQLLVVRGAGICAGIWDTGNSVSRGWGNQFEAQHTDQLTC